MKLIRTLPLVLALIALANGRAQTQWTAVPAPVTRTLWGICWGGGQFVAVGEGGTIVTSPDGLAWAPRASGTDAWLTSVCYAVGNYLAVGERGTVLASHDGIAWSPVPSGSNMTSLERLNVVGFNAEMAEFVAYGEHDVTAEVANLMPGNYTAVVEAASRDAGVALVEVYEVP